MNKEKQKKQNDALNVLLKAVEHAQKRGAFTLSESRDIANAIDAFLPEEPTGMEENQLDGDPFTMEK